VTDNGAAVAVDPAELGPLPTLVTIPEAFSRRIPTQRVADLLQTIGGGSFSDLMGSAPQRVLAFRALLRDYPLRDPTSLWLHAYDVEIEVAEADPTSGRSPTPPPLSAGTGGASPTTSTT
jgi:hypothetical protein